MSLVGWWKLDGDVEDSSGNGNNGSGSPNYVDGKIGQGIQGDGSNIGVSGDEIGSALSGNQMTLSLWWKQTGTNNYSDIISTSGFRLERGSDSNPSQSDYWCNWGAGSSDFRNEGVNLTNSDIGIPQGEWFHIVVRRKGSDLEVWIDGELDRSTSTDLSMSGYGDNFVINPQSSDSHFDDIRLYDRALSKKEIKQLSRAKVLHYKLDTSGEIADASGQGYDGTLNGASYTEDCVIGSGAYDFDGSNDWIDVGDLGNPGAGTISLWVKKRDTNSSYLLDGRTNGSWWFLSDYNGYDINLRNKAVWNGLNTGQWYHVVATGDSNETKLYINGDLKDTGSSLEFDFSSVRIGARYSNSSYFNGKIDDLRIYSTVLSSSEVEELYQQKASIDDKGNLHTHELVETNPVSGSSFEDTSVGSTTSNSPNLELGGASKIVSSESRFGSRSLRGVDVGDNQWQTIFYVTDATGNDPNADSLMKDGETWTVSFYAKSNDSHNFNVGFAGGGGYLKTQINPNSDWTHYEVTDTVSNTTNRFQIRNADSADGQIFFDGFKFSKGTESSQRDITIKGQFQRPKINEIGPGSESLVGWWPLDGDTKDYSGNGNDGTNNGATITSGLGQSAYSFDVSGDYIDIGSHATFVGAGSPWTILFWLRPFSISSLSHLTGVESQQGSSWGVFSHFGHRNSKLTWWDETDGWRYSNTTLSNNNWYQAGLSCDGSGNTTFWLNGKKDGTASISGASSDVTIKNFARRGHSSDRYFNGKIQDVRIFNRALTSEEVKTLYNLTDPRENQKVIQSSDGTVYTKGEFNEIL